MQHRREPVPRAREAWVWLGAFVALGLLGGGVVAAAIVLWENVDVRQVAPALAQAPPATPVPASPEAPAWPEVSFSAVLFTSPRNAAFFPDRFFYRTALAGWRAIALEAGASVRDVSTARELEAVSPAEVLLVPEAPCLSAEERAAIRRHVTRGGGLVANWALGARDGECQWLGWDVLTSLTGALDVRETQERSALYLTVPGGTSLSPGLDPGTRIEFRGDKSLALRRPGTRVYWSDWALNPAPDESGGGADVAAVATRTSSGGRVAWLGPRLDQAASPADSLKVVGLARNGVLWAAGIPVAQAGAWPGGQRAAVVVALEVESQHQNAYPVASLLRERRVPGTFFAVTQLVSQDTALAAALTQAGEVGTQTNDHSPLRGRTFQDQAMRLFRSWQEVLDWTGEPPRGLRPPEEALDNYTVRGWERAGGDYLVALNEARSASPERYLTNEGDMVLLPRLMKDDYNVVVQDRAILAGRLAEAWIEGAEKLRSLGGLAVLAAHTQIMGSPARRGALGESLDTLRAQGDWWMATGGEVADWWRNRSSVRLAWVDRPTGPWRMNGDGSPAGLPDLIVEVPESWRKVSGLWVDLVLPGGADGLVPWVDGRPSDFAAAEWGIRVPVGELAPGATRRISLVRMETSVTGPDPAPGS